MAELRRLVGPEVGEAAAMVHQIVFARSTRSSVSKRDVLQQFRSKDKNTVILGVIEEDRVATAAMMKIVKHHANGLIQVIATRREFRGRGFAGQIMNALESEAAEQGANRLSVVPERYCEGFYERYGFAPIKGGSSTMVKQLVAAQHLPEPGVQMSYADRQETNDEG